MDFNENWVFFECCMIKNICIFRVLSGLGKFNWMIGNWVGFVFDWLKGLFEFLRLIVYIWGKIDVIWDYFWK